MDIYTDKLDKIKRQIEFYFSDSNIRHDKYFRSKLTEYKYLHNCGLPISLISTFNRIIELNASVQDIINSLSSSKVVFVNIETLTIHRFKPINIDLCTIIPCDKMLFIKRIPKKWNHNNVKSLLGRFGKVSVVKLPKINKSNRRRHYGFVEMETAQQARNAIENYKEVFPFSKIMVLPWSEWISTKNVFKEKSKKKNFS
ncbi:La domain-containing [Cryptosporidium sp. chipmunk genotype I]|uniref:La domain-containing n=1 Tax=Cryptosporidium sp. chipmunk genotype I TaxID=1280935 RepID=UPI003519F911|nr:La domain-containing [Cryptosporidium sp. chipmunk genotype I]